MHTCQNTCLICKEIDHGFYDMRKTSHELTIKLLKCDKIITSPNRYYHILKINLYTSKNMKDKIIFFQKNTSIRIKSLIMSFRV